MAVSEGCISRMNPTGKNTIIRAIGGEGEGKMYDSLVSAQTLLQHIEDPHWSVFDCHYVLDNSDAGTRQYKEEHIPGAAHLDIGMDLAGPHLTGVTGRHPLPASSDLLGLMRQMGVSNDHQIVFYDRQSGMFAARAWWLLRWLGHEAAAVLDGGMAAWTAAGGILEYGASPIRAASDFVRNSSLCRVADVAEIERGEWLLLDARSRSRYAGQGEWVDPVAGHIPGAINAPYTENLNADGYFLSREELRAHFRELLPPGSDRPIACYCGSGISAAHTVLALHLAGYPDVALYPGSWSEWITDLSRPIARGSCP